MNKKEETRKVNEEPASDGIRGFWVEKIRELEEHVFSEPWYKDTTRRTAFLIGLLAQRVAYKSQEQFSSTKPVKRFHAILKAGSNEDKMLKILEFCEQELLKIEGSQKRSSPLFGKKMDSHLRTLIHEHLRKHEEDFTDEGTLIAFFDGYQYFLGSASDVDENNGKNND